MQKVLQSLQISLLNIGYAHLDAHWDYDNVISPFSRLYYITKGSALVYHNNKEFELKPGFIMNNIILVFLKTLKTECLFLM